MVPPSKRGSDPQLFLDFSALSIGLLDGGGFQSHGPKHLGQGLFWTICQPKGGISKDAVNTMKNIIGMLWA